MHPRIGRQSGGQTAAEEVAVGRDQQIDPAPGFVGGGGQRVAHRVAVDLRHQDEGSAHCEPRDHQYCLPGPVNRLAVGKAGEQGPPECDPSQYSIREEEQADQHGGQAHQTTPASSLAADSIRPSRMRTVRRARSATCGLWVTSTMVWPSLFMRTRSSTITLVTSESRLPVGSSAQTTAGLWTSARATATRCCSPPDSWSGRWLARWARPRVSSISNARRRESRELRFWSRRGISTFSTAESTGSRLKAWKTKPMFLLR